MQKVARNEKKLLEIGEVALEKFLSNKWKALITGVVYFHLLARIATGLLTFKVYRTRVMAFVSPFFHCFCILNCPYMSYHSFLRNGLVIIMHSKKKPK